MMQPENTLQDWLREQTTPLTWVFAFVALMLVVLLVRARRRRVGLMRLRVGIHQDTFVDAMMSNGFDPEIAGTVYRTLQQKLDVCFPIEAGDRLGEDLGLNELDLDETVREVLKLNGRTYQPGRQHTPPETVEDLVRLVQASPRVLERAA